MHRPSRAVPELRADTMTPAAENETPPTIAEAVSENKRGRPPLYSKLYESHMVGMAWPAGLTRRQQHNHYHALQALRALMSPDGQYDLDPRYAWLCNDVPRSKGGTFRVSILAELGRLDDPGQIREWADWLCEHRPKAKTAVAILRRARLGKAPPGDGKELYKAIVQTINTYLTAHPDTPWNDVHAALLAAHASVTEANSHPHEPDDPDGRFDASVADNGL